MTDVEIAKLKQLAMAAQHKLWVEGVAGSCNVVDYDGEDVVGIAYARSYSRFIG